MATDQDYTVIRAVPTPIIDTTGLPADGQVVYFTIHAVNETHNIKTSVFDPETVKALIRERVDQRMALDPNWRSTGHD